MKPEQQQHLDALKKYLEFDQGHMVGPVPIFDPRASMTKEELHQAARRPVAPIPGVAPGSQLERQVMPAWKIVARLWPEMIAKVKLVRHFTEEEEKEHRQASAAIQTATGHLVMPHIEHALEPSILWHELVHVEQRERGILQSAPMRKPEGGLSEHGFQMEWEAHQRGNMQADQLIKRFQAVLDEESQRQRSELAAVQWNKLPKNVQDFIMGDIEGSSGTQLAKPPSGTGTGRIAGPQDAGLPMAQILSNRPHAVVTPTPKDEATRPISKQLDVSLPPIAKEPELYGQHQFIFPENMQKEAEDWSIPVPERRERTPREPRQQNVLSGLGRPLSQLLGKATTKSLGGGLFGSVAGSLVSGVTSSLFSGSDQGGGSNADLIQAISRLTEAVNKLTQQMQKGGAGDEGTVGLNQQTGEFKPSLGRNEARTGADLAARAATSSMPNFGGGNDMMQTITATLLRVGLSAAIAAI